MFFCFVLAAPKVQAVLPQPDGGYPGGNTAEGQNALFNLTSDGFQYGGWLGFAAQRDHWQFQHGGWREHAFPYQRRRKYSHRYSRFVK
jgi:hypothetical protein